MKCILISLFFLTQFNQSAHAEVDKQQRNVKYRYGYADREHELSESLRHIGVVYGLSWATYYLTQPATFRERGSFKNYKEYFGEIVFDKDEPIWNWVVHPYSGSQLYLYYRANGYDRINAIKMTLISSTLFEFFVEIYTEPASFQDLYQTPILGSLLGLSFEEISLMLLNTGHPMAKVFGHILNPYTLFWFYEGKVKITPTLTPSSFLLPNKKNQVYGLTLSVQF